MATIVRPARPAGHRATTYPVKRWAPTRFARAKPRQLAAGSGCRCGRTGWPTWCSTVFEGRGTAGRRSRGWSSPSATRTSTSSSRLVMPSAAQRRGDDRAAPAHDGSPGRPQRPAGPGIPGRPGRSRGRRRTPRPPAASRRFAPAVPDGRLGHEAQAVPRPVALTDRRAGPVQRGARVGAATLPAEHDGVDQGERGVAEPGPDQPGRRDLGSGRQAEVVVGQGAAAAPTSTAPDTPTPSPGRRV